MLIDLRSFFFSAKALNPTTDRKAALGRVFAEFDLNGGGTIEAAELMAIGKMRRCGSHAWVYSFQTHLLLPWCFQTP